MLDIEPRSIVFRDIRLNQSYTSSLCITNPLPTPVSFTLRPSSSRYVVSPNRINLAGGQSIVVTVRLYVSNFPNYAKGVRGHDDAIHIQSSFFEQKIDAVMYLHKRDTLPSRSPSPQGRHVSERNATDVIAEMNTVVHNRDNQISQLKQIISQYESDRPDIKEIITSRVEQEKLAFEEKSEKVIT